MLMLMQFGNEMYVKSDHGGGWNVLNGGANDDVEGLCGDTESRLLWLAGDFDNVGPSLATQSRGVAEYVMHPMTMSPTTAAPTGTPTAAPTVVPTFASECEACCGAGSRCFSGEEDREKGMWRLDGDSLVFLMASCCDDDVVISENPSDRPGCDGTTLQLSSVCPFSGTFGNYAFCVPGTSCSLGGMKESGGCDGWVDELRMGVRVTTFLLLFGW